VTPTALLFASFSLSAVFANLTGAIGVADTSQLTSSPSLVRDGQQWDLETVPLVQLSLAWPESALTLGYGPRLLLRDAFETNDPTLLHLAQASYRLNHDSLHAGLSFSYVFGTDSINAPGLILPNAPDAPPLATDATEVPADANVETPPPGPEPLRVQQATSTLSADIGYTIGRGRLTLALAQSGELQEQTLAGAVLGAPINATATPTATTGANAMEMLVTSAPASNLDLVSGSRIRTGSETSAATLDYKWTPTLHSSLTGSYRLSGGLGDRAELLLPLQRTAFAGLAVVKQVSPRDTLSTDLSGTQTEVTRGPDSLVMVLTETWHRQWSPYVDSTIGAGVAVTSAEQGNGDHRWGVEPTATGRLDATVWRQARSAFVVHTGASVQPTVNPLTGNLQTRVAGDAGAALRVEETEISADGDVAQTLPSDEPDATRVIGASTGISQELAGVVFLSARYRSIWQNVGNVNATGGKLQRQWSAVFALTLIGPAVTF
jgi:hypothetical protein